MENKVTVEEAARMLALQRCGQVGGKKASTPYEIVGKQVRNDFSLAMINYNTRHSSLLPEVVNPDDKDAKP